MQRMPPPMQVQLHSCPSHCFPQRRERLTVARPLRHTQEQQQAQELELELELEPEKSEQEQEQEQEQSGCGAGAWGGGLGTCGRW